MRVHGGNPAVCAEKLDFSANINPLGMPEAVRKAVILSAADCVHYPDPDCTALVRALADAEQIPAAQIVCGSGAADLIFRIAYAFRPQSALICAPAFSEYASALHEIGCAVTEYPLYAGKQYQLDAGFLSAVTDETDMVFLCTPNNPTGQRIPPALLAQIAAQCRKHRALLICDECFLRFSADAGAYSLRPHWHETCIILNAFTKLYGIPGLRLGYALCGSEQLAARLRGTGQYWSVSVPAQAAGIAALQVPDWIPQTVCYVRTEREYLIRSLRECGITVYDSAANFLLLRADARFAAQMEASGIIVRKCTDFHGLSDAHFRIAVRSHRENLALIAAVREVYGCAKQS